MLDEIDFLATRTREVQHERDLNAFKVHSLFTIYCVNDLYVRVGGWVGGCVSFLRETKQI